MKETIIEKFAGPYDRGEYSPSVQKTLYETQVLVLDRILEVSLHFRSKLVVALMLPTHIHDINILFKRENKAENEASFVLINTGCHCMVQMRE